MKQILLLHPAYLLLTFLMVSHLSNAQQRKKIAKDSASQRDTGIGSTLHWTNEVVVSASRVPERILTSPITIEKIDLSKIKNSSAPTFFDALENVKGVQMTTLGLNFKVPNTRGFTGTTNARFLQMIDGIDNTSPGIGAPISNFAGPTELDVESVEIIPGAASALYGLNAVNGISNIRTKSPFQYPGLSVYERVGINHINDAERGATRFSETAIRFAKILARRFAFKLNASYSKGTDWIANNHHDQYFDGKNTTNATVASSNPGADLINRYGDEYNSDLKTITLGGKKYDVSRTGYYEKDLTDYSVHNAKVDASLYYKMSSHATLSYLYRLGVGTGSYQRGNRTRLDGERIQQHVVEFKNQDLDLKTYYTLENTGSNSYNFRALGENIDLAFKKPTQWYNDFTKAFNQATTAGASIPDALNAARASADNGRYVPGTRAFDSVKNRIVHTNNWDTVGAQYLIKSRFIHAEGQYDFTRRIKVLNMLVGANCRNYIVTPDGNNFVNPASFSDPSQSGKDFSYDTYGGFVQLAKTLFQERLSLTASLRIDKTEYFSAKANPRVAMVFSPTLQHHFRASFQNGYRFPTLYEAFTYVNNGGVRRLGGLPIISQHLGVFENSYLNSTVTSFKNAVNRDINSGTAQSVAIANEAHFLVQSHYTYIQPEHVNAFEVGYKGLWMQNRLFVDVDYYLSAYDHFIGQVDVTQPYKGSILTNADSTAQYAYLGGKDVHKFKMWTNSTSKVTNQGVEAGLSLYPYKKYQFSANGSYARLVNISLADAFTPAFNTPDFTTNVSISNPEVAKNVGFNVSWHWQDSFFWSSPLATGHVPGYGNVDGQVNYCIRPCSTTLKLGVTDLFNKRYYQYLGGPTLGSFYYFTIVFDANTARL